MAKSDPPPLSAGRAAIAVALTAVAGFVDALGWLALDHVFTAQMSGNTVLVAVHAAAGDSGAALLHVYTIGMFLLGLLLSGIVIEIGLRRGLRRLLAAAMALEAVLLAVFAIWGRPLLGPGAGSAPSGWAVYLLVAVSSLAMGVQNTSLRMAGVLGVYTTHVTGTLSRLSEDLVVFGFGLADRLAERQRTLASEELRHRGPAAWGKVGLSTALFVGFLAGAWLAAYLVPRWGYAGALAIPIGTVVLIGAIDAVWPLGEGRRTHEQNA